MGWKGLEKIFSLGPISVSEVLVITGLDIMGSLGLTDKLSDVICESSGGWRSSLKVLAEKELERSSIL